MKNLWLILLVFVFSLQAALAAVQPYDGHILECEVAIETVLHAHADSAHEQHPDSSMPSDQGDDMSSCSSDHHHCHAHSVTVMPSFSNFEFPLSALTQSFECHQGNQSCFSNRIERPKWV